jgi:hypothetical protein
MNKKNMGTTCWPTYVALFFYFILFVYDFYFHQWMYIPFHALLAVVTTVLLTITCSIFGDIISGFLLLVPLLVVLVYILVKLFQTQQPAPIQPPPVSIPESKGGDCIDPTSIPDCKKLVQVLVKKEDAAVARCKARQLKKQQDAEKLNTKQITL